MKLRLLYILIPLPLIGILIFFILTSPDNTQDWVTTTVERGDVQNIVSISGFVEAKNTANLSFPVVGIVTDVFVEEGDQVGKGDLLATLGAKKLVAQRADAVAVLEKARAARDELVTGPTTEARSVTQTTVLSAQTSLEQINAIEAEKVSSARTALLSNGLEARTDDAAEEATPPVVSGSYACEDEGFYTITMYRSSTHSGYSYVLSGLESGSGEAGTEQAAPLGTCGLFIQFNETDRYSNSIWTVEIPNTKSSSYVTYKNAYDLAVQQEQQNVQAAQNALTLATDNAEYANADPSSALLRQAEAAIYSAQAKVAQMDAQIAELSIAAPFNGIVTTVDILPGETAGTAPVITILAEDAFELKARVPEIDITKINTRQHTAVVFDAQSSETLSGTIAFVSPLATEIDGVAYFETTITLDQTPPWIRSGLNADVDIIVEQSTDVLRIPARFLIRNPDNTHTVLIPHGNTTSELAVEVVGIGNGGHAAITGLNEGDIIVAP